MTAGTLARYTTVQGIILSVKAIITGRDQYGPVTVLRITGAPKGSAYKRGEIITVSADSTGLALR
jgi:hypothetical protein